MDNTRSVYGIDLGTTYSCIAQVDKFDQAIVLRNFEGDATTPSAVYFEDMDHVVVGKEAKGMLATEPTKTAVFIKRHIGVDDSFDKNTNEFPYHYDPTEISAFILKKLVKDANDLGDNPEPIKDVVITCPAYFGTKERMQTKQAGEIAGLNVLSIINEPTAAAISYGVKTDQKKTVLVYDLGGGTFDVTLINVNGGAIKVIATGGDHHLGGVDWDTALAEYMLAAFNEQNNTSYSFEDRLDLKYELLLLAEDKKKVLTAKQTAKATYQYEGNSARIEISRELFNSLKERKLDETIDATKKVIAIAKEKGYNNIDEILLVGGSSRMPQIKERVDKEFNCDAKLTDPDECVAKGAAIYAMNAAYSQAVRDYEEGESDDKPAPLRGDRTTVVNVTSKTYGTDVIIEGQSMVQNLIFANSSLPTKRIETFTTSIPNQRGVSVKVFESDFTNMETESIVEERFCTLIDDHTLKLSKDWPQGTQISVTYQIDQEGILHGLAYVENDKLEFDLKITGVKCEEELRKSKAIIDKASVE